MTCKMKFGRLVLPSAAFAIIAGSGGAIAQVKTPDGAEAPGYKVAASSVAPSAADAPVSSPAIGPSADEGASPNAPTLLGPEFQLNASASFSESYVSNATGYAGHSEPDYLSMLGFSSDAHEHSRRITFDANYNFTADFYAKGGVPTQIGNTLQALANVDVIPEHLDLNLKGFAEPIVTGNFGVLSAGDRVVPGGFTNSYGYTAAPDLKFNWGNFAILHTIPSYGQVFFETPAGTSAANTIPLFGGPTNTTLRSLTEEIDSGTDFDRLNWKLLGQFSETAQPHNLLSEKSGIADGRYALNYEWSLLVTAGYDSISQTQSFTHNLSGPVALGGFGLTLGKDFSLQLEAGQRYHSLSFDGNLRYDLSPSSKLIASATDAVQTPNSQLLSNLSSLTALPNGSFASANDVLANGTASSLSSFSVQSADRLSLNQLTSRYQTVTAAFIEAFGRTQATLSAFGSRITTLTPVATGAINGEAWGVELMGSRNLSPLLTATLGGGYTDDREFGNQAKILSAEGELNYSLSRKTSVYLRSFYLHRTSSASLLAVSPLSGDMDDFQIALGISHTF